MNNNIAIPEITLTSSPPPSSSGCFCPGPVQFTCVGTDISYLGWRINNTYRTLYEFFSGDTFPLYISLSPPLPDVSVMITSASYSGSGQNIVSTLTAGVSDLRGTLIECINVQYESSTTVQERQGTECINNSPANDIL